MCECVYVVCVCVCVCVCMRERKRERERSIQCVQVIVTLRKNLETGQSKELKEFLLQSESSSSRGNVDFSRESCILQGFLCGFYTESGGI
jgi:hypothetical protein